jgi:uncharacterized membrane protein (DUF2068 family)
MNVTRPIFSRAEDCPPDDESCQHLAGLRTVALLEMLKGLLVLAGGIGLITLLHKDIADVAQSIIEHLHINPAHHLAQIFIAKAGAVNEKKIVVLAFTAFAYAGLRAAEAYGLWNARAWAEWLAIISGSLYLPWEIIEVAKHDNRIRWAVLIVNIVIVLYMIYVRWDTLRNRKDIAGNNLQAPSAGEQLRT